MNNESLGVHLSAGDFMRALAARIDAGTVTHKIDVQYGLSTISGVSPTRSYHDGRVKISITICINDGYPVPVTFFNGDTLTVEPFK